MVEKSRTPYLVYVDEAGDRGWGGAASPVFVLTAIVIKRADDRLLRDALDEVNIAMRREPEAILHWAENIREHSDRKMISRRLGDLPIRVINIVVCKSSLMGAGSALNRPDYQYNYLVRRLLERVSWLMDAEHGVAELRFAHVRRFKYDGLFSYLRHLYAMGGETSIKWEGLKNGTRPRIDQPSQIRGLQVADLMAGCVYAAVRSDRHGDHEATYLEAAASRLWSGPTKRLTVYGLHFVAARGHRCGDHFQWMSDVIAKCG